VALAERDRIELDDLPPQIRNEFVDVLSPSLAGAESMRAWACRYARLIFERCGRNKRTACRVLDVSYHTLQTYLRESHRPGRPPAQRLPAWVRSASDPAQAERSSE
jgi:hypothetical protein